MKNELELFVQNVNEEAKKQPEVIWLAIRQVTDVVTDVGIAEVKRVSEAVETNYHTSFCFG